MSSRHTYLATTTGDVLELDEDFMVEWVQFGLREMEGFLHRQAKFAEYLRYRESYLATGALWLSYPEDHFYPYDQEDAA